MHSAIVVVDPPKNYHEEGWKKFLTSIQGVEGSPRTKTLSEHIWMISVQDCPAAFARLVDACERHRFAYSVLAIESEPRWLPGGFGLETK